tara:strand:+ start:10577 stop:11995 length:1419 start_codon:yes stop_codon:yes gene_type:complete
MIDISIIALYLLATLFVGIWTGRNIKNIQDYAVSHRNYSAATIVATLTATMIGGGSTFGVAGKVFSVGIIFIAVTYAIGLNKLLIAPWVGGKIAQFEDQISVGGIMGSFYGKECRVISGLAATFVSIAFVSMQVSAMGHVFSYFLGISVELGILIGCGIVIAYSAFGGMRSVVTTDVMQFAVLIVAIPIACTAGAGKLGGITNVLANVPLEHLTISPSQENFWDHVMLFFMFLLVGSFHPSFMQRWLIAKDKKQALIATRLTGIISIPFFTVVGLIGLVVLSLEPTMDPNSAMPYMIDVMLPVGIKGLTIAGIMAVIMSTADSELNIAGISLIHDVINPLRKQPLSDASELKITRISTFLLGVSTVVVSLNFSTIIDILLYTRNFWVPTIVPALVIGLAGYKGSPRCFWGGFFVGVISLLLWNQFLEPYLHFDGVIPAMLFNATTFFIIRMFESEGQESGCEVPQKLNEYPA